jgi:Protein of unknown function (DUF3631)
MIDATPGEEEHGEIPELAKTATAAKATFEKYVAFHSDHAIAQAGTLALYTLYTWIYDDFRFAPILLVTAPTSESGKSRLFDVAELLVRQPYVVVDPSGPSLRNIIDAEHPTIMIDEADLLKTRKDLRAILNAGVEKGRFITRATGRGGYVSYDPFGPKMLAGIYGEVPPLKGATLSRCIQIELRRRYDEREEIADFDKTDAEREVNDLAGNIKRWSLFTDHDELKSARPEMPAELTDRQRDAWRPLVVIGDRISPEWGKAARAWAVELSRAVPVTPDLMVQVMKDVYRVLVSEAYADAQQIKTATLARARDQLTDREYDEDLSPIQLAKRLARFGIKPIKYYEGKGQVRGFRVRNQSGEWTAQWADAIGRYRLAELHDDGI